MVIKVVRNYTQGNTLVCISVTENSVNYLYKVNFRERGWKESDDIQVLIDNFETDGSDEATIFLGDVITKEDKI